MAEAPADPSTGDNLEQKTLQVLSDAGGPVKIGQLLKKCQVPKKTLNQVLYRLKTEGKVSSPAPATWSLGRDASGDGTCAIPEDSTAQPSLEERILRFLEAHGPQRALHIAKALGMTTAKEVNPLLYTMRSKHLLSHDGQRWSIYRSSQEGQELARSEVRQESSMIIHQQNPINMICQQGPNSQISIAKSKAIQIGHGNVMLRQTACGEPGPRTPHHVPLPVPEDASAQDRPPGAHGAQHIHMDKSMLRCVQLGHGNEMRLVRDPGEHSAYSFSGSPPVSTTTADPHTSFNMQTPEPGSHPEGDTAQRVHIKSCLLEDATIGNSNKMTIYPRSKGGVVEPGDSEEPKGDTGASSEATPPRSCLHMLSDSILLTCELRTMSLGDSSAQTSEPVLRENEVQDTESCQAQD
ncbi:Z-DNA-binding protein 1 isoform X1 [Grammomys surdaster]|uniref:Z-DNA-binding protein 1 isoform X1 n=1 Tax=Grammomys surdaster TaxID=491861 RepID=UPI00109FC45E|nr:Z-DNA-binding protein 1 isoform X1 [Grammomys surdaster]XP_028625492.1 Z-DNA-binding protein 1 isoform X1 [Grammomys surdaster]XP_028625493.1 Z-DNA-binding protein 1 isoform X1 [Grammomys surdaster]